MLAVVEQCLLLHVLCLTLIVNICTFGPRAKKRGLGKAVAAAASLANYSSEPKQDCAPSAGLSAAEIARGSFLFSLNSSWSCCR